MTNHKIMKIKILSPTATLYDESALSLTLKTINGEITFLPNHIDFVGNIVPSIIQIKNAQKSIYGVIGNGIINFLDNEAKIVTTSFKFKNEINIFLEKQKKQKYEKILEQNVNNLEIRRTTKTNIAIANLRIDLKGS